MSSSILQFPQAMNTSSDLQIWNNAAFESEDNAIRASSWSPVKSITVNPSESLDSFSSKENQSPVLVKSPVPIKIPTPAKPLHPNGIIGNSQGKPTKRLLKQNLSEKGVSRRSSEEEIRDEQKIDAEIEEIQMEISRLNSRLEILWLEKAEQKVKALERRGRVVPAKFMEPKQGAKITEREKKIEEASSVGTKARVQRRGLSLGPSEIAAGVRRGVSLGPSEIFAGVKPRQLAKPEINITPAQPIQNRRKSCFWTLQDIDEEETKGRRTSLSVSPKSRKITARAQALRQAATTVGSKKGAKKEDGIISSIQPKKLFKDGEKSVPANKKPLKPGRVVASRYNQHTENSAMRKRSLPENDKDDGKRRKSQESLREATQNQVTERKMKKKWEIPSAIVVYESLADEESLESLDKIPDLLPPIRTIRCTNNSPRDSGPAKRVAQLVGRKSYFCSDENSESAVCQALSFEEDAEEK
ncbi:hypothetical protein NMG60_11003041 [Bertholletia excelsa]